MDIGRVPDGHPIAHKTGKVVRKMEHRVVLHIAVVADDDAVDVSPEHRPIPDAAVVPECDVPDHHRGPSQVDPDAEPRDASEEGVELSFERLHGDGGFHEAQSLAFAGRQPKENLWNSIP
jgi:hypothetical protein